MQDDNHYITYYFTLIISFKEEWVVLWLSFENGVFQW